MNFYCPGSANFERDAEASERAVEASVAKHYADDESLFEHLSGAVADRSPEFRALICKLVRECANRTDDLGREVNYEVREAIRADVEATA